MNNATAATVPGRDAIERYAQRRITERIEHLREHRGLSVRVLADMLDMNYSSLSHRIRGRVAWSVTDVLVIRGLFNTDLLEGLTDELGDATRRR